MLCNSFLPAWSTEAHPLLSSVCAVQLLLCSVCQWVPLFLRVSSRLLNSHGSRTLTVPLQHSAVHPTVFIVMPIFSPEMSFIWIMMLNGTWVMLKETFFHRLSSYNQKVPQLEIIVSSAWLDNIQYCTMGNDRRRERERKTWNSLGAGLTPIVSWVHCMP